MARLPTYPQLRGIPISELGKGCRKKKKGKRPRMALKRWNQILDETTALKDKFAWSEFKSKHMVGLYAQAHQTVFGILPDEVRDYFGMASAAAGRMLKKEFDDNPEAMIDFLQWFWANENRKLKYKQANDVESNWRPGWRYQFSATPMTDYRVWIIKQKGKR